MFHSDRFSKDFDGNVLPVRPYGLHIAVESVEVEPDKKLNISKEFTLVKPNEIRYEGFVEGRTACGTYHRSPIAFSLPKPNKDGTFIVGSTMFRFANIGFPSPWKPFKEGEYHYLSKPQVAIRVLENMFGGKKVSIPGRPELGSDYSVFSSFFFQSTPEKVSHVNNEHLQSLLLSRLVTHPFVRQVQQTDKQIKGTKDLVILFPRKDGIKIDPKKFREEMLYKLCPISTSASDTINTTYQLADGARIYGGRIIRGNSLYCRFVRENSVFLEMSPSRAYLARSAVMNAADLTYPEDRPISHPESVIDTRNLKTAIMDLGVHTFEDTIAMSQSCSARFEAQTTTRISRWSPAPIAGLKAQIGDMVQPSGLLAVRIDAENSGGSRTDYGVGTEVDEDNPRKISLVAAELREEAVLEAIEITPAWYAGRQGVKTTWVFRSFLPMMTGDKITCFSGCKGVVTIVPDDQMPFIDGQIMDICVSSKSVFKRGCISLIMEAALGRAYYEGKFEKSVHLMDNIPLDFSWAAKNYRRKSKVNVGGQTLPEKAFWGYVPWFRISKSGIASRRVSAVGRERPLTGEGLLPDKAKVAGQSLDTSKSVVLISREMTHTLNAILDDTPAGRDTLYETVAAIDGPAMMYKDATTND